MATIVICALIGGPLALFLVLFLFKKWMHGPTAGSDNKRRLDDKVAVITGKCKTSQSIAFSKLIFF